MNDDTLLPFDLPAVCRRKLAVDFNGGTQSSDAGLLLFREAERKLGVCRRLAAAMPDRRDPNRVLHEMFEMVMARSSPVACGYKDAIDHDRLRHDPLMKVAVGRCPQTGAPLASQSTSPAGECAEQDPSGTAEFRYGVNTVDFEERPDGVCHVPIYWQADFRSLRSSGNWFEILERQESACCRDRSLN
jgi:hypothetical protein